jgi:CHAD domain-containing protein
MDEREAKLSADEQFRLPDLTGAWDSVTATPQVDEHLSTVYLDSEDLRLARWDLSFRYRDGEGWTVKLPGDGSGPALVREELVFDGTRDTPPPSAVDLLTAYLRHEQLHAQARLETLRHVVLLHDTEGQLVATVVHDEVSVLGGHPAERHFREVEVEATPETPPGLLEAVVGRLRDAGTGAPERIPKYLRALGGPSAVRPEVAEPELSRRSAFTDVVTHAISEGAIRLIRHDPVIRLDSDVEGVHQARVATRRLRSDLRTFRSELEPRWTQVLRDELGWLGGELGAARDADVLLARITARARTLSEESAAGAQEVIAALERRRADAYTPVLEQLRSDRYLTLLDRLIDAAHTPALRKDEGTRRAAKVLRPLVRKAWRALDRKVASLGQSPADADLHLVRITAKRCRYAAEASAPVLGTKTGRLARAAADLQDTLGELHDAVVAESWLRDWAGHGSSSTGAFVAGELAALEDGAASEARAGWRRVWKRLEATARDCGLS